MNDLLNTLARSDLTRSIWPGTPDPLIVLFTIVLAFGIGMLIGYIYMWTHEALSYSRTFVGALAVMPLIVSMLMVAMAGNLFVAFGLLGVFGVVRFRNVLKDTRDTSFILWAIVEGVAIGTLRFSTAALAALGIAAAFLCLRFMSFGTRRRYDAVLNLRVTGDVAPKLEALKHILKRHATRLDLASERRATAEGTDMTYRLLLRDTSRSSELQSELTQTEGFANVSVYMHEDEAEI
ncbi:MAG TPA: DUF4956 domain-containing protein [Candidatus Binatia bacterium]|jgi:hypothetical protein|nr:DUF4956 domain-containing protein [Candidatus Binatia bacterium]